MRILIISMTVGEGHNQIAKALKGALEAKGADCKIMQLYGFDEKSLAKKNKTFLNTCKYIPNIYNRIWLRTCEKPVKSYIKGVIKKCSGYMLENVNEFAPDIIICTHNEAGVVLSDLISKGKIDKSIKTYGIVLDYCVCPYWEYDTGISNVVIPDESMTGLMLAKGFKKEQLLPYGIPVDGKYSLKIDKLQAREELGLEKDKFTVVLYSGGNCASSAYKIIKKLLKCKSDIQMVAVCGKNKKEFEKIEKLKAKKQLKNVLNIGFCTCLDKVYSAGDIVITRGGGVGVSEQINKQIPLVLREKLITNENINKIFFDKIGLGIAMKKLGNAPKIVDRLANDKEKLADMQAKAKALSKPNAMANIVEHILNK